MNEELGFLHGKGWPLYIIREVSKVLEDFMRESTDMGGSCDCAFKEVEVGSSVVV